MKPWISAISVAWTLVLGSFVASGQASNRQTHPLEGKRSSGSLDRVEVVLEVAGNLKVPDPTGATTGNKPPMKVTANLTYEEKTLDWPAGGPGVLRSVRHYEKADASLRVDEQEFRPVLRDERRLIANEIEDAKITLFNPSGTLTREELDLIELPGNSLLLEGLLPDKPVALNDTWKHPDWLMAAICTLDAIGSNDAQSVLRLVSDGVARIEISGRVEGIVSGLSTSMELKGKYHFDIKTGRITWFAVVLKENRAPGLLGPGLDVVARLQMKVSPLEKPAHLTEAALQDVKLSSTPELRQLHYKSPDATWEVTHDRRWIVHEGKDTVLLRMADAGDYIAQCNVAAGSVTSAGSGLTLAKFQDEIRQALGKSFGQLVRAEETKGEGGLRAYHVVVQGEAQQMPIRWIYHRLSDRGGRQIILAFTVKRDLLERFGRADEELIAALRFLDPKLAAKPTPAADGKLPEKPRPVAEGSKK